MKEKNETISVRLPRATLEHIEGIAELEGGKRGAVIRRIVMEGVRKLKEVENNSAD